MIVIALDDLLESLDPPFVINVILPVLLSLIAYMREVPNVPPLDMIPLDAPDKDAGFIQASIVKLPVIFTVDELGTET